MDNKIWGIILFTNLNLFHQLKAKRRSSICGSVVRAIASKHSSSNPANGKILKLLSYAKKICTRCFDLNRRYFVLCLLQKLVNECLTVRDLDSYECSGRLTNKLNTYKEIQILKQISWSHVPVDKCQLKGLQDEVQSWQLQVDPRPGPSDQETSKGQSRQLKRQFTR